jgi:alpha-tubulin suppressor-like RCC1 family protein
VKRILPLALLAIGCGSHPKPSGPIAMTIRPVDSPNIAPALPSPPDPSDPKYDLATSTNRICIRHAGSVYCANGGDLFEKPVIDDSHRVAGIEDATSVAVGGGFLCASKRDGSVVCSGDNSYGQLGANRKDERIETAVRVADLANVKRVMAAPSHACALLEDRSVRCWGRNEHGQTGSDTYYTPEAHDLVSATAVPGVEGIGLAATYNSTCALRSTHDVICWGAKQDQHRPWGTNGATNERPTVVPDLMNFEEIAASESEYCGIQKGSVACWSSTSFIDPNARYSAKSPWIIGGVVNAKHLAIASDHGCAILANGKVNCFGFGYSGALGYQSEGYDPLPGRVVEGVDHVIGLSVASGQTCALTSDDELFCWGRWYSEKGTHDEFTPARAHLR